MAVSPITCPSCNYWLRGPVPSCSWPWSLAVPPQLSQLCLCWSPEYWNSTLSPQRSLCPGPGPGGGHSSHSVALTGDCRPRFPINLSSSWQDLLKAYYVSLGSGLGGLTSLSLNSHSASYQLGDPGLVTSLSRATVSSPVNWV